MIIAVTGEKGGTGKTTLAVNLAGMRAAAGSDVIIMDADRQGSASYWTEMRDTARDAANKDTPLANLPTVECVQKFGATLYRTAVGLAQRYNDVVIDLPSGERPEMDYILDIADVIMVPFQPASFDAWTVGRMDVKVEASMRERPNLRAYCLLNRTPHHPKSRDKSAAISALNQCTSLVYPGIAITDRSIVRRAGGQGLTITEYQPANQKTIAEFRDLYDLLFGEEPAKAERNGAH